jgi:hypothetical protein
MYEIFAVANIAWWHDSHPSHQAGSRVLGRIGDRQRIAKGANKNHS